jgi:hypothetical protein
MLKILSRDIIGILYPYLTYEEISFFVETLKIIRVLSTEYLTDCLRLEEINLSADKFRGLLAVYIKCKIFDPLIKYKFLAYEKAVALKSNSGSGSRTLYTRYYTTYRLTKDGKSCKQKSLYQSIKSAVQELNLYRSSKFAVDEEIEKLAVMIYPVEIVNKKFEENIIY